MNNDCRPTPPLRGTPPTEGNFKGCRPTPPLRGTSLPAEGNFNGEGIL